MLVLAQGESAVSLVICQVVECLFAQFYCLGFVPWYLYIAPAPAAILLSHLVAPRTILGRPQLLHFRNALLELLVLALFVAMALVLCDL